MTYWNKSSLLIPNVFRLARLLEEEPGFLFEHQDLSKKELLVQSNGQKARVGSGGDADSRDESEDQEDGNYKGRKGSASGVSTVKKKINKKVSSRALTMAEL